MNLVNLTEQSKQDYEQFLAAARGSFLQSWEWGEFQASLNQKVFRFALVQDQQIKIAAQFIEQTIPHLGGKYLYAPHGPNGDLQLTQKFLNEIAHQFPDYWFIRVEPTKELPNFGEPTLRIQPGKTLVIDLSRSEDELQKNMHQKTRYNIRVAQKHGVEISTLENSEQISEAIKLISETSKRQNFTDHPASYYQALAKLVHTPATGLEIKISTAQYKGQLLNCAIFVDSLETRTYLFGGSSDQYRNVMAPYLLHWHAIQDAKNSGKKFYDWWGIETATGKTPGFARFKLGWGGKEITYPQPQDSVIKPIHYQIYKFLRILNRLF